MEDQMPLSPTSRKRSHEDEPETLITTPVKSIRSEASSPLSVLSHIGTPSPMKSKPSNATVPDASSPQNIATSTSTPQPAKRRKLTQQERDDQRLEKEAKAKARAEKRAQKELEDKLKAELKAQKDEERRKKIEERDEKKRQKEEEQQQKEDEKAKKERAQTKLNAFFVKPKSTAVKPAQAAVESTQNSIAPSIALPPDASVNDTNSTLSPQKTIVKNAQSDYDRYFLPFNIAAHVILAPRHSLIDDPVKLMAAQMRLDKLITQDAVRKEDVNLEALLSRFPKYGRRGLQSASIAEVVERVNGSSEHPIDLTNEKDGKSQQPLDMLKVISMKYLHFAEDVRPPYYGTYTKSYSQAEAARLARNPHARVRQDTNYDYDSEAEWEEPEEGEDLDSEGEEDVDEEAEDDMDGFLDDEEDPQIKRRLISGDLIPISTGLCWEDVDKVSRLNDGSGAICTDFKGFSMGFLHETEMRSIDPFSAAYWAPEPNVLPATIAAVSKDASTGHMNPPRAPLVQRTMNGLLNTLNSPQHSQSGAGSKPTKAKRLIPTEQLPAFKAEIEGKDLTKIGLIEALKKVFPKLPKDAIANTLSVVAARVGPTEKEKRWVLINN